MIRTGIDIVFIPRMRKMAERGHALTRVFHPSEMADTSPAHLAGIFAAKEALFKALGKDGPVNFLDAEIVKNEDGKPAVKIAEGVRPVAGAAAIEVSISHDGDYAVASVVVSAGESAEGRAE